MNTKNVIEVIETIDIQESLKKNTRQYLVGNLKLPQQLEHIPDSEVEVGINEYKEYTYEKLHYHTKTSEYCYIIDGETKYVDINTSQEYHFNKGDFFVLRSGVSYLQKVKSGCKLYFVKVPGLNDKVELKMDDRHKCWVSKWDNKW